jgi:hypothetical protein
MGKSSTSGRIWVMAKDRDKDGTKVEIVQEPKGIKLSITAHGSSVTLSEITPEELVSIECKFADAMRRLRTEE